MSNSQASLGEQMHKLISKLFPICRSITGDGFRQTLNIIKSEVSGLTISEIPTGTKVFDWTVPKEWNITDAWVKNSKGEKVIDFKKSNLQVVNYSVPIQTKLSFDELKKHLYTLPDKPELIPYRTTYYKEDWGFCLPHNDFKRLDEDTYEVMIDSSLKQGSLTIGELAIKGKTKDEVLVSVHGCHPSLCNDNLSGLAVATFLAKQLKIKKPKFTYRFLFIPGTIGSISWLAQNREAIKRIKHGLVLTGVGDSGIIHYKKTRQGDAKIDQIVEYVLNTSGKKHKILNFHPFGYDERQYCSPGINLPVGCFMRSPHETYPEYHTSADNLSFIKPESLQDSFLTCLSVFEILEDNKRFLNLSPYGEPQLGKRGIYEAMAAQDEDKKMLQLSMLWVLNQSDGENDLLAISKKSGINFKLICKAADILRQHKLLKEV